jgi:myo-inositol-1-phosphate synthase
VYKLFPTVQLKKKQKKNKIYQSMFGILVVGLEGANGKLLQEYCQDTTRLLPGSISLGKAQIRGKNPRDCVNFTQKHVPLSGWDTHNGVFYESFVHSPNIVKRRGPTKQDDVVSLAHDIDMFAEQHKLSYVVVLFQGSTERNTEKVLSRAELKQVLETRDAEELIAPSQVYALATVACTVNAAFVNGAAQCTITPAIQREFSRKGRICAGRDLLSGQTRFKYLFMEMLMRFGMDVTSVISTNFLGNNDALNLRKTENNQSKISTKSSMFGAMQKEIGCSGEAEIEHHVSIHCCPTIGDDKIAHDRYQANLYQGKPYVITVDQICPDSYLALGVCMDLCIFTRFLATCTSASCEEVNQALSIFFKSSISEKSAPFLIGRYNHLISHL